MAKKKIYENGKELRSHIPIEAHHKLTHIQSLSESFSRPEALVIAIDIAHDVLTKKHNDRIGIVNGTR